MSQKNIAKQKDCNKIHRNIHLAIVIFISILYTTTPVLTAETNLSKILGNHYALGNINEGKLSINIQVSRLPQSVDTMKKLSFAATQKLFTENNKLQSLRFNWQAIDKNAKTVIDIDIKDYKRYLDGDITYEDLLTNGFQDNTRFIHNENALDVAALTQKSYEETEYALLKLSKNPYIATTIPTVAPVEAEDTFLKDLLKKCIDNKFDVEDNAGFIGITIYLKPDISDKALTNKSFQIMQAVIEKYEGTLNKIDIIWTAEKGDFGKKLSLPSIYIDDYKHKKISKKDVKTLIAFDTIEPYSRKLNQIEQAHLQEVTIENIRKAKELREAAYIYLQQKDYESAARTYTKASTINPNDKLSYYWLGKISTEQKRPELAKEFFEKSLAIDPNFRAADEALADLKTQLHMK